jgi:NCS1 family nucleobase:cation symporter-1
LPPSGCLLRRGHYDYGGVNWRTIGAYAIGVAVEVPFVSTTFYTGPLVERLGGADVSWVIGLVVASALYYLWTPREVRLAAEAT